MLRALNRGPEGPLKAEGERALLIKQLQRLDGTSTDELARWGENVLEAQTLEEVFTRHGGTIGPVLETSNRLQPCAGRAPTPLYP